MIPILYGANEKDFISNGLGKLSDAESCEVTEERNGIFELTMKYPVSGIHFSDVMVRRIILAKPSWAQDPQPFDIVKITPSTDGMDAEIYAQHISYRLADIPVKPFTATGMVASLNGLKSHAMIDNDFDVWTDINNTDTKFKVDVPKSFRACLGGTEGSILQTFSGSGSMEFMWDGKTVKVYRDRGQNNGVTIQYGKNLTSLEQETSIEDCYTGVLAYWADSQTDNTVCGDIQYIENHDKYPHERIFIYDASQDFQSDEEEKVPTVEQLNNRAISYATANDIGKPKVSLDVSFVDLSQTEEYKDVAPLERVNLCDTVTVYFPKLGVNSTAKVIKTEWDVLKDRYESIELGDTKSNFSDTIKQEAHDAIDPTVKQLPTKTFVEMAIDEATKLIKGGTSGHMIIGTNANGEANELFFMDTTDPATAKNVLRINMNGIAFSQTGIEGKFTSAWTIDGQLVADFITLGTLSAVLIKTGLLSDAKGLNWWNMDTGEFHLSSSSTIGDGDSTDLIATKTDVQASEGRIQTTVQSVVNDTDNKLKDYVSKDEYTDKMNDVSDQMSQKMSRSDLEQESDSIRATVMTEVDGQIKKATQWLDDDGVHVDTGETTQSNVDGNGMTVTDKQSGEIIAQFVKGESQIQNVRITGMIKIGAHRMYEMDGEEFDGTTVKGTGFMWSGGE